MSLNACLDAKIAESKNSKTEFVANPILVREDQRIMLVSALFPTSIGIHRVEYLDSAELKRRYSRLRAEFPVVGLEPMNNAGPTLIVKCSIYRVQVRHGTLTFGVSGGWEIHWRYDCVENKYVLVTAKRWWLQM